MPQPNTIGLNQLAKLIGTQDCPRIVDVRIDEDFNDDPRLIPGARRRDFSNLETWAGDYVGHRVTAVCHKGKKLSEGVAAILRARGIAAEILEGGMVAWREAGLPLLNLRSMPERNAEGKTIWVTRARPKVDRIACPWFIRRFVDPHARFLYVAPQEVLDVADRFGAIPFDVEDAAFWHAGDKCTFDALVDAFGIRTEPLDRLSIIVRGADTGKLDLAPQAAGLLAISLGLSRAHSDDLAQLEAGLGIYDALYRWCRDAVDEDHRDPRSS